MTPKEWLEWIDGAEANKILGLSPMRELLADWTADRERLLPLVRELRDALKQAARLIDELGASPLELAAKYGPDYMPPDIETLAEMRDAVEETAARADKALAGEPGEGGERKDELAEQLILAAMLQLSDDTMWIKRANEWAMKHVADWGSYPEKPQEGKP